MAIFRVGCRERVWKLYEMIVNLYGVRRVRVCLGAGGGGGGGKIKWKKLQRRVEKYVFNLKWSTRFLWLNWVIGAYTYLPVYYGMSRGGFFNFEKILAHFVCR